MREWYGKCTCLHDRKQKLIRPQFCEICIELGKRHSRWWTFIRVAMSLACRVPIARLASADL